MIKLINRIFARLGLWLSLIGKMAPKRGGGYMGYKFPEVLVAEVEKEIELKQKAESDGRNNLPGSQHVVFSLTEEEAITKYDERRHKVIKEVVAHLDPIKNKIIGLNAKLGNIHFYIDEFKNRVEQSLNTAEGKLSSLKDSFDSEDKELRHFKLANNITRDPQSLTPLKIIIGILLVVGLFVAEVMVNTRLLAPALEGGEQEGMTISFAVAVLNVFISFLAGYFIVKNFNLTVTSTKKIMSKITLGIYTFFIIYLNLGLGGFRAIAEKEGKVIAWGSTEAVASTGMDFGDPLNPFSIDWSFNAAVLTFVGISFALVSLLDGYFFNDPYPGYGGLGKLRNENKNEIKRIREHLQTEVDILFKNEIKRVNDERTRLITDVLKNWSINATALETTFAGYRRFAVKIGDDIDHIMGEYRAINGTFRTTPAPKYWLDDQGQVKKKRYEMRQEKVDPTLVFEDMSQMYYDKKSIEEETKRNNKNISEETNNYIAKINEYKEIVNKKIQDVKVKYNVQ